MIFIKRGELLVRNFDEKKMLVVYFSDYEAKEQLVIHDGTIGDFREVVGKDFDSFGLGDRFEINFGDEGIKKVRVGKVQHDMLEDGRSGGDKYFVYPAELDFNKVNSQNLDFEKY